MQPDPEDTRAIGRHAVSDPDRLARLAAEMPPIPEDRVDTWDRREWMTECYEPEVADEHP